METPNVSYKILFREKYMLEHFPEFVQFLKEKYRMISSYKEMVYLFINQLEEPPICPTCGKYKKYRNSPAGYGKYCDRGCVNKKETIEKIKSSKYIKYGDENFNGKEKAKNTNMERYGTTCTLCSPNIKEKAKNTNIERYGVDNPFKSKDIQQKITNIKHNRSTEKRMGSIRKYKQTCVERYGVDNPMKSPVIHDKFKSTMVKKYGVEYAMLAEKLNKKCTQSIIRAHKIGKYTITHRKNNTFCTSKIEEQFTQYLTQTGIKFIRQYHDSKYPFDCDFYIPQYDLYIEIQGTWTHGWHPFDPKNKKDIEQVERWSLKSSKYYGLAIYVWTELDPKKRKTAADSQINYLEIFSIDINEVIKEYNNFINGLENRIRY